MLMKLVRSQLTPVVKIFREEGKTETQQPHIHEYENGFTLVLPAAEKGFTGTTLRIQFEFYHSKDGYLLRVKKETEEGSGSFEKNVGSPITEEKIRDEIRKLLKERQDTLLNIRK